MLKFRPVRTRDIAAEKGGFDPSLAIVVRPINGGPDKGQREKEEQEKKKAAANSASPQGAATGAATGEKGATVTVVN